MPATVLGVRSIRVMGTVTLTKLRMTHVHSGLENGQLSDSLLYGNLTGGKGGMGWVGIEQK